MKKYLYSVFVEHKQTTGAGMLSLIGESANYAYQWNLAHAMPDPKNVVPAVIAGLFLIFWAHDPRKEPVPVAVKEKEPA